MNRDRLFVVENETQIRRAIAADLSNSQFDVVFFADGNSLLCWMMKEEPACVILDHCHSEDATIELLTRIQNEHSQVPILVLYGESTIQFAISVMRGGAGDFIPRSTRGQDLLDCVHEVLDRSLSKARAELSALSALRLPPHKHLSIREREIFGQIVLGRTTKEIGQVLNLSHRTVESHRASIRRKTGNRSWIQLALAVQGWRGGSAA